MMEEGVVVPIPKDPGGGYTHEQHKQNYKAIYQGGRLYKLTGEQKYADYVRDMLLVYAKLYPTLGEHPARKDSQGSGRLFWQVLNDAMWMVDSIQGYEAIRDSLSEVDRKNIDENVFRKAAEFLSTGSAVTFSKIHNHATWATAGVGMTGYVLGDKELVDIALLGLDKSGETGVFASERPALFARWLLYRRAILSAFRAKAVHCICRSDRKKRSGTQDFRASRRHFAQGAAHHYPADL